MKFSRLGRTDISVSRICFGTMTFGEQTGEADAHRLLDQAIEAGVNFLDVAEMYPVPPRAATQGLSEAFIGTWLKARGRRDRVVVATKACGLSRPEFSYIRGGNFRLDRVNLEAALDASLKRLCTDHVDLYQLHWPDRQTTIEAAASGKDDPRATPLEATLEALAGLIKAGKVRAVGISNETAWGTMRYLALADARGLPRMAAIQNRYSLLARTYETDLAEIGLREQISLLAFSPLCMGVLSGKYLQGKRPPGSRMALFANRFSRYLGPAAERATQRYAELARIHGLEPAAMAIAFAASRPFVASAVIGATTADQLAQDIAAGDLVLSDAVIKGIEAIHLDNPSPCP